MEISRDGHRARMRAAYLQGGGDAMPDHQLLELLLSISIPRKDVKPIAYALINRFGSLEQVFAAGAADLEFTIRLLSILRSIHVQLLDHIIVSPADTYSMRSDPEYGGFFTVK